jgi:hypothetical protein
MRAGQVAVPGDPTVVARFTLDAVLAYLVIGPVEPGFAAPEHDELLARLVSGALIDSRDWIPFAAHSGHDAAV